MLVKPFRQVRRFAQNKPALWKLIKKMTGPSPREAIIHGMLDTAGVGLEIGPSYNPMFPKSQGYKCDTVDHADAEELRAKYKNDPNADYRRIEDVDYVWTGQELLDLIPHRNHYDYVFASHVIEHMTDIVGFFNASAELLKPTGTLVLAVPDKRFCFDAFQRLSSTGEVLEAFREKRKRHTPGIVFDMSAYATHKANQGIWSKDIKGEPKLLHPIKFAVDMYNHAQNSDEYIDVHAWRFTPSSFRLIAQDLHGGGFTPLNEAGFHDSMGCEFFISLSKTGKGCDLSRDKLCLNTQLEVIEGAQVNA